MKYILRGLPVVAVLAALSSNTVAAARSPSCGFVGFTPHSSNGAFRIVAHGTTCPTARNVAAASWPSRFRYGNPLYNTRGFSCSGHVEQLGGNGMSIVRFYCVREGSSVSFLRG